MTRVCNGCLNPKPIVNQLQGFCEYCEKIRNQSTNEILSNLEGTMNPHLKKNDFILDVFSLAIYKYEMHYDEVIHELVKIIDILLKPNKQFVQIKENEKERENETINQSNLK